ncbi:MAG: helix-turn-helix domain-containing protein [Oscillospiraceae bacterium]
MIQSLSDPAFLRFGAPLPPQAAEGVSMEEAALSAGESVTLYRFPCDTVWDHGEGMTVLLLREGEALRGFYLDRPVRLRAGTVFGFAPLQGASRVLYQAGLAWEEAVCGSAETPAFAADLRPMRIFTCFLQQTEGGFYFRGEQHLPYELVYLKRGTLHNYCGGQDLLLRPRELLLIPSGQWHIQYADETVRFLTISFFWEGRDFRGLTGTALKVPAEAERLLQELERETEQALPDRDEYLNAALKLLLLQLQRHAAERQSPRQSPASERMQREIIDRAMQAVSAHIQEKYTVPELAAAVNVSPTHLSNLFRRYLGMSPAKYITRIRVEECKALLTSGEKSVGEIAAGMGYSSAQHFCKQFRQWTGLSPAAFAKGRQENS